MKNKGKIIEFCNNELEGRIRSSFLERLSVDCDLFNELIAWLRAENNIRAEIDIQDVKNDPNLETVEDEVKVLLEKKNSINEEISSIKDDIAAATQNFQKNDTEDQYSYIRPQLEYLGIGELADLWLKKNTGQPGSIVVQAISPRKNTRAIWLITTTVAALILTLLAIRSFLPIPIDKQLSKYNIPMEASLLVSRIAETDNEPILSTALEDYENGRYSDALKGLGSITEVEANSGMANLYSGLSFLGIDNYAAAINSFNKIDLNESDFRSETKWYMALAYLGVNEIDAASELLKDLADSEGYYRKDARRILRRLK